MATKDLSEWILNKVVGYLTTKEGCTVGTLTKSRLTIQDSLGFRYEVKIKLIGRVATSAGLTDLEIAAEHSRLVNGQ